MNHPINGRAAIFAVEAAINAGFKLGSPGGGYLDIWSPPGMAPEIREPIVAALARHKDEVLQFLAFIDAEAKHGIYWSPPETGAVQ